MKKRNKRLDSTKDYVDALQNKYSKLNVVRLDFAYKKPHSDTVTFEEANKDFNNLLNNRRNNSIFDDHVGYICKKEDGEDKGVHFHVVFFFNGQKTHKDILKAKQIGEYWNNKITTDKGSYHNCNMNNYKEKGVGMLDHKDKEKRKKLDNALAYLCKEDTQILEPTKTNKNDRAFVRGTISKEKNKLGRKRKDKQQ